MPTRLKLTRRPALAALAGLAALTALAQPAAASNTAAWPQKPVRVIVNFPPGSSPDVVARAITVPLSKTLGQPFVIDNRSGAGGSLGADAAAKSAADGYTLLASSGSAIAINPHVYRKLPYDAEKDLAPVAAAARIELFLVARENAPFNTFEELLAHARARPGQLTYGSPGNGTAPHIAGEMLKEQARINLLHVPYRGAANVLQDVLAGQIDLFFDPGIAISHIQNKKLKLIAVGSLKRSSLFSQTPTLDELGLKGFDAGTSHAFYLPAGTPQPIVQRLNQEINRILQTPAVISQIHALGAEVQLLSPQQLHTQIRQDHDRFGEVVRRQGIRAE
ncbi:Bug family tripartite tricarboxylate transporter substrate binding protein [Comamonas composti]|uniref:Bug family tripartite tricarboxylate transporter substrate binding protein n=1 Tax=Comamonas composti TaxID=408558 RepID=UPI000409DFB1|nr:tripartite tricarboxylate transporter substrate binding protein [Comamonas composti]